MTILEAISERHSVRDYEDRPIAKEAVDLLETKIKEFNEHGELHIQLVKNEPKAFDGLMAHYVKFSGVKNYIALIGKKSAELEEKCGYYGERLVLLAQTLGLNTCWVAMTYKKVKTAFEVLHGEKLVAVISLGYGKTQGVAHKTKPMSELCRVNGEMSDWFRSGMEAAMLAPTAMNQQNFMFTLDNNKVSAKAGIGFYTKMDLGIAKCHFEIGAGKENFIWSSK